MSFVYVCFLMYRFLFILSNEWFLVILILVLIVCCDYFVFCILMIFIIFFNFKLYRVFMDVFVLLMKGICYNENLLFIFIVIYVVGMVVFFF